MVESRQLRWFALDAYSSNELAPSPSRGRDHFVRRGISYFGREIVGRLETGP